MNPSYEFEQTRHEAEQVPCPLPQCHAQPGEQCTNLITGQPLEHQPAHYERIKARGSA